MPIAVATLSMLSTANSAAYWAANAFLLSQSPTLIQSGVYGYVFTGGSVVIPGNTAAASVYIGDFVAPGKTSASLKTLLAPIVANISATWSGQIAISLNVTGFPDFYSYWYVSSAAIGVGTDIVLGSRLLDGEALSSPTAVLMQTLQEATQPGGVVNINLVSGPGVWSAVPRGGNDSVHPSWRKAYVHFGKARPLPLLTPSASLSSEAC
jgi:hypothetical protein